MKIFEFDFNEATDWYYDSDMESAKAHYISHVGGHETDLDDAEISEVPKDKWTELVLVDPNEFEPDEEDEEYENYDENDYHNGYKIISTFAEFAKEHKDSHEFIASTEF